MTGPIMIGKDKDAAKGTLVVYTGPDAVGVVPAGREGEVLVADPAAAAGVRWGKALGGGVETVSGTVTFDPSTPFREVYATGAATVQGEPLAAGAAAVFRYLSGRWEVMVMGVDGAALDAAWRTPGANPNATRVTVKAPIWTLNTASGGGTWATIPQEGVVWSEPSGTATPGQTVTLTATPASRDYILDGTTTYTQVFPDDPAKFEYAVTHFTAEHGTPVSSMDGGGLTFSAPTNQESNNSGTGLATGWYGAGLSGLGGGVLTMPVADFRISLRRCANSGAGNSRLFLNARGQHVLSWNTDGSVSIGTETVNQGGDTTGVIAMQVTGSTVTVWVNDTQVWTGNVPFTDPTSKRVGFYIAASIVTDLMVEKATAGMTGRSLPHQFTSGMVASDTFTGADGPVTGRKTDNAAGGTAGISWTNAGVSGWSAPALAVAGGEAVRAGSGANISLLAVKSETIRTRVTLTTPPTGGAVRLIGGADTPHGGGPRVQATPTAYTIVDGTGPVPCPWGAPEAGDKIEMLCTPTQVTFDLTRQDDTNAEQVTSTVTRTNVSYYCGVAADSAAQGFKLDDFSWSAS